MAAVMIGVDATVMRGCSSNAEPSTRARSAPPELSGSGLPDKEICVIRLTRRASKEPSAAQRVARRVARDELNNSDPAELSALVVMAGNIEVCRDPLILWQAANWAFDFVIRELRARASTDGHIAAELDRVGHPAEFKYLDITDWSRADRDDLAAAVRALVVWLRETGPTVLRSPEFSTASFGMLSN